MSLVIYWYFNCAQTMVMTPSFPRRFVRVYRAQYEPHWALGSKRKMVMKSVLNFEFPMARSMERRWE